ncbi:PP2C family serine/threonine-protein phosphatase [Streptomyces sp. MA25(2023)]|uniref:PP2C family serine/threonine-protein phosphatase n=1 Tax=Streptomyces sp. MA25(2023) TaxID=3055078 RepID=UPI0025B1AA5B|nr:PP2C family serine/threonine-protein phosphatase [Streptomyces sp. MA25(2023)]MDN3251419.1 protein phosphatase 2C domain-containing protein [Streptomyces sp. MA25(2023)]
MSQMPQQAAVSKCPSCEEPLESGDRFCGACGYDLSAVPARPDDSPTIAMNGAVPPPSSAPDGVDWPVARDSDGFGRPAPVHAAAEVPGTDSGGSPLPPPPAAPPMPSGAPPMPPTAPEPAAPGARFDHRAGSEDYGREEYGPGNHGREDYGRESYGREDYGREDYGRGDGREPEEYPLQAPDPRSAAAPAEPAAPAAAPTAPAAPATSAAPPARTANEKVCVACRAGRVDNDGYCENCGHAQPRERDHMEQESGPVAAVSDRGLRHHRNEDAFSVGCTALPDGAPASVAIVCDGVSSATRPDDASLAASRAAGESLLAALPRGTHPQQAMHDAILAASHAVNALAEEPETAREQAPHQNAPACTLVGAVVAAGLLVVGWVGDSRVYWVPVDRSTPPARLTEDDSWAAQMVAAGLMSEAEAYADERAHAITGWLGADAYELEPHTAAFKPDRPGVVVVCTDGLWNYAESAEEMADAVPLDAAARPLHSARVLVGHALDGGGHDNVTVALLPFPVPPQGAGSA